MGLLPETYEAPSTGRYMKFEDGDNRFRVLDAPIMGMVFWTGDEESRAVHRRRMDEPIQDHEIEKRVNKFGQVEKPRHFWAMPVWSNGEVKILEITQVTVQRGIAAYDRDPEWGDFRKYDLNVRKSKNGDKVEYQVMALPPKPLPPEAQKEWVDTHVNMEALFDGGDPFEDGAGAGQSTATQQTTSPDKPANDSGEIVCTINEVNAIDRPSGRVFQVKTSDGDYYTGAADLDELAEKHKGSVVHIGWILNDKGGRNLASIAPVPESSTHTPVDDDDIPF